MPLKSKAQARYLFSRAPSVGQEMADKTPSIKKLPERVAPKGSQKNKPVTKAFKPKGASSKPLASYDENSRS
jgi:hypothetical protein